MTITIDELIEQIKTELGSKSHASGYSHFDATPAPTVPASYTMILGAGFSCGIVPFVNELMTQSIGDYYYPAQDQWGGERPESIRRKDSASFWKEFNWASAKKKLSIVEVDKKGLPKNTGAAYQNLFMYEGANALFSQIRQKKKKTYLQNLKEARELAQTNRIQIAKKSNIGEQFVKGFLRYVLDPGSEHGYGSSGRSRLNSAHIHLAALLEAQQLGRGWSTGPFCRTLLTTNFDTLLQNSLQMVNVLYRLTDRPEKGLDHSDFDMDEGPIHLVYVHGSILRYNPASSLDELHELTSRNVDVLHRHLASHNIIIIGYSGWNDGLMAALRRCNKSPYRLYWCDISPEPNPDIARLLKNHRGGGAYVCLGDGGADNLMRSLYEALIPAEYRRDLWQRYRKWYNLVWDRKDIH